MKNAFFKTLAAGLLVASLAACGTQAAPPAPQPAITQPIQTNPIPDQPVVTASGRWNGELAEGATSIPVRATIVDNGGVISGTMSVCFGACLTSTSLSGTRAGNNITMTATFIGNNGQVVRLNTQGAISGNNISGSMTFNGLSGQLTLDR